MSLTASPPLDRLLVFDDLLPRDAKLNMAVDEVLLGRLGEVPLLRIYRWARPAVSFGYFTPWAPVADSYPERESVRRWTGGGIVEHGNDLTYSLLIPRSHPLTNRRAGESYRVIHAALRTALIRSGCGVTTLAGDGPVTAEAANGACFAHPVAHDLLSDGQKISGGAQRRTRHGLLHQGSVLLADAAALAAEWLAESLPPAFARRFDPRAMSGEEEDCARQLASEKYADDRWMRRV